MPDWSYRTVLQPLMLSFGSERSRRLAVAVLRTLSRVPFGLSIIDFLGHMRPDEQLRTRVAGIVIDGPIALGALIDPSGEAIPAFSRFGVGMIEVGPVEEQANGVTPRWNVDWRSKEIIASAAATVSADLVAANLKRNAGPVAVCVHIGARDNASVRRVAERLHEFAAIFVVDAVELIGPAGGHRPVLLRVDAGDPAAEQLAARAIDAGAAGIWLSQARETSIRSLRSTLPARSAIVAAGNINEPADAGRLLEAGADVAVIGAGLVCGGPGLVKRCNEAILSTMQAPSPVEPLSLDAGRRAWFWALLLGVAMFSGGVMAAIIGSTRVVMPYDESLCGLTRAQMVSINPRLIPFMAHDRLSLAGTMLSIGILYGALAWFGIRRGEHWARAAVLASATTGFLTFFFFLGFEYFDPFHAFVTAILPQFTLLCVALPASPRQPPAAEWREHAAWRRGQWGQLLFVLIGAGLTGAGIVISYIGCTSVFVDTDLAYMRTTAAELRVSFERLVPLVAHDRATLGGMLIANGIVVWLAAQWGMRAGARWLWMALAWSGNIAFAIAVAVHVVVGYGSLLHLAPAFLGWAAWNAALLLSRGWLTAPAAMPRTGTLSTASAE
jgi:dihydroorotate dehydrogenase